MAQIGAGTAARHRAVAACDSAILPDEPRARGGFDALRPAGVFPPSGGRCGENAIIAAWGRGDRT
jgi:hypothetical protein